MVGHNRSVRIHVHDDALALDGTRALIDLANSARPLEDTLCAMCKLVGDIASVDVVSVYLRESRATGDALVLRGNVGFPASAIGTVELALFDGLTGVVAERRRPVTVAIAQHDRRYKHVEGIGEERFPAYLGVPLLDGEAVIGVFVLQRVRPVQFTPADVALASSLTAPFLFAIERRPAASPAFCGATVVDGTALGPAIVLPTLARPRSWASGLQALELDLVAATQRLRAAQAPEVLRALANLTLVTQALRAHVGDADVLAALERVPFRTASGTKALGALLDERRGELADLARFLAADAQLAGGVLVVPRVGAFLALEAVAHCALAVISADAIEDDAREILRAGNVPAISGVPALVDHLRGGELLDLDATRGRVRTVV